MTTSPSLPLLVLSRPEHAADPDSERGVECPGGLPAASDPDLVARAEAAKAALGSRVFVLGHHYQRDEVIRFADVTGDSFKLAREAAARPEADYIVFCGVHFMAESADILTASHQQVILPDLAAGCSMADMARLAQVEDAWDALTDAGSADVTVLVHPECTHEVVTKADLVGSTEYIIKTVEEAPAGSAFAIGTELNLVQRLATEHPDKRIAFLDKTVCFCSTMNRIDLPHFVWAMENLVAGNPVNVISVDLETEKWAKVALDRMLALPSAASARD